MTCVFQALKSAVSLTRALTLRTAPVSQWRSPLSDPADTSARITAASLLGGNYQIDVAREMLASGAVIYDTRDPVSISDLLGKMVFSSGNSSAAQ